MKTLLIYLLLLISTKSFAQFQIMNSNTSKTLEDVHFINDQVGIAVGDSGTIVRSIDGGLNWSTVLSIDSIQFQKVAFFDTLHGVSIGNDIYTTSDAGLTWILRYKGRSNFNHTGDLEILNDSTCLASNSEIALMRSINKGLSWDTLFNNSTGYSFRAMSFINDTIGFASSAIGPPYITILKTTNGGLHWDTLRSSSTWNNTVLEDLVFINEQTGFQTGWYNGHFFKTTNGGNTWNWPNLDSTISTQLIDMDIHIDRPNAYYACGWYGEILKSNDGGSSWQRIDQHITTKTLRGIYFINDTLGWVVGSGGSILRTTNGGGPLTVTEHKNLVFEVYPNPTQNILHITLPAGSTLNTTVDLLDLTGQLIKRTTFSNLSPVFDLSYLPSAVYLIRVKQGNKIGTKRIYVR